MTLGCTHKIHVKVSQVCIYSLGHGDGARVFAEPRQVGYPQCTCLLWLSTVLKRGVKIFSLTFSSLVPGTLVGKFKYKILPSQNVG